MKISFCFEAYLFYIAEANGTPDTTLPVNHKSLIRKLGKSFALVENPSFDAGTWELSYRNENLIYLSDKLRERKITEVARVSRPLIAIHLPNELKTLVPFEPELKISQLLIKICFKRGNSQSNHSCRFNI